MKFQWLPDPLIDVLYEDEDILAVDKPYGIDSHTNDSKQGNADFLIPGLIEIFERKRGEKLHIVHRLDRTTTGVIVFGKSLESAKKFQQYFRARETKKTYVFVTAAKSKVPTASTDQVIVHKGAELEASTDFKRIATSAQFEKWEAYPHTGRNHQIRIHGAHVGLPLLGDLKYGGAEFPFLCLHNRKIEFPNGVCIESEEPRFFTQLDLLENRMLAKMLHEIDRRERLFKKRSDTHSYRLADVSDKTGRICTLDQFGSVLSLNWYRETWSESDQRTFEQLAHILEKPILVRLLHAKHKLKSGAPEEMLLGSRDGEATTLPLTWSADEGALQYALRTDRGQSTGLFLDQRLHREWVRQNSKDLRVLNLFSFTGGYTLAAAAGGAVEITSVDTHKASLNWVRENLEKNRLSFESHRFLNRDALQFLEQCVAKETQFDLILCDAPSFSRGEKGVFKLEVEIDKLVALLLKVLAPAGRLLFATHHENLFVDDLRRKFERARSGLEIASIQSSLDFELPGETAVMKSFLINT